MKIEYDKLVRDKIPEIIQSEGKQAIIRILGGDEYLSRLKSKLLEEAKEASQAKTQETLCEELADLYEVIDNLMEMTHLTESVVQKKQIEKREERGGFQRRILLMEVDDNE